jgi:hypothetical protein
LEIASIKGMPPSFCGSGNTIIFEASPRAGFGRIRPIMPSASFVKVLITIASPSLRVEVLQLADFVPGEPKVAQGHSWGFSSVME